MTGRDTPATVENRGLMFCARIACGREITKRDEMWMSTSGCFCSTQCRDAGISPADVLKHRARIPASPFADLAPHQSSSETSRASATVQASTMRSKMFLIYEYLRKQGVHGATRQEIADMLGISLQTVCGRVRRLYQMGRAGSNCVEGCRTICDHEVVTRLNQWSRQPNEVMLHEDHVFRWQADQQRPPERLSWESEK